MSWRLDGACSTRPSRSGWGWPQRGRWRCRTAACGTWGSPSPPRRTDREEAAMCGIAGWVDYERDLTLERETAEAMTATMSLRGPDDEGLWLAPRAAIGHRRLAVIDIEGGRQPMVAAGDIVLTYSGEGYNYRDLRAELAAKGHAFRTASDTEVVLRAYEEWGVDMVHRLNGMYAFAVWDGRTEELLLVRDRLGIKPLFWYPLPNGVLFGSE